jgi:hypothetical protein
VWDPPVGDLVRTEAPRPRQAPSDSGSRHLASAQGFAATVPAHRSRSLRRHLPPALAVIKGAHHHGAPPFSSSSTASPLLCRSEHHSAHHHLATTDSLLQPLSGHPRALVQRRTAPRPSRLPPRPLVPASTASSPSAAKCLHADEPLRPCFGPISTSSNSTATPWISPSTSPAPLAGGPPLPPSFLSADQHHHGRPHQ